MIYYVVVSFAATLGSLWFLKRAGQAGLARVMAIDIALVTITCGFIGARLMHVFYEEPAFYAAHPWQVLAFWYGGFVYLGGVGGALLGAAFFCDWRKEPFWVWADLAAPPAALAYAIGRVGCFLNGCCYGTHCDLPWAVQMHGDLRHPTQLYAFLWDGILAWLLLLVEPRLSKSPGALFGAWLAIHGCGRLLMEHFRDDPRGPLLAGQSISSWLSGALITAGTVLLARRLVPRLQSH